MYKKRSLEWRWPLTSIVCQFDDTRPSADIPIYCRLLLTPSTIAHVSPPSLLRRGGHLHSSNFQELGLALEIRFFLSLAPISLRRRLLTLNLVNSKLKRMLTMYLYRVGVADTAAQGPCFYYAVYKLIFLLYLYVVNTVRSSVRVTPWPLKIDDIDIKIGLPTSFTARYFDCHLVIVSVAKTMFYSYTDCRYRQ